MQNKSNGAIIRQYVLPQMLGLVCNSLYFIVDGIFIGARLGPTALAAAGVAKPVIECTISLSMMLGTGAGILIAQALGHGAKDMARRMFNHALWLSLGMAAIVCVLGMVLAGPLAGAMGGTVSSAPLATAYMRIFFAFSPFLLASYVLSSFARNNGQPRYAMLALMGGAVLNILLDWVFMYPLDMGIQGAALATGLGPVFSVLLLLPTFFARKRPLRFMRPARVKGFSLRVLRCGLPAFVAEFSIGLVTLLYNLAIARQGLGDFGLASYLVIGYAALICLTAFLGAAEGLQPAIAWLYGAGEHRRIRSLMRASLVFITAVAAVLYGLLFFFGRGFYGLFLAEEAMLSFTAANARIYFACLVPAALNILLVIFMQCTGRPGPALTVSLLRSVGLVGLFLLVLPGLVPNGLWWAIGAAEACTLGTAVALWYSVEKRKNTLTSPG